MKRIITKLTMLALTLVMGSQAMWAETEWQTVWQTDFSSTPTGMTYSVTNGSVDISTGVLGYNQGGGSGNRAINTTFTDEVFKVDTDWKLEFDWGASSSNLNPSNVSFATNAGTVFTITWNANAATATVTDASSATLTSNLTIDGYTKAIPAKLSHFTIIGSKDAGITLTVTYAGATVIDNVTVSETFGYPATFNGSLGRAQTRMGLDNIAFQTPKIAGFVAAPTFVVTGTNGISRIVELSSITEGATILWSETVPAESETYADWNEYNTSLTTSAATIYAVAKQDENYSEVTTITTGAGTEIKLNAPVITKTGYSDGNYSVSFSSTQADLSVVPSSVIYSYSIDGGDSKTGSSATVPAGSAITVTTTADGYANSDATTWVSAARPTGLKAIFGQDYTSLTSATGIGACGVVLSSEVAFSCSDKDFYHITGYNNNSTTVDVDVTKNVGLSTSTGFSLRCNGNNSGILQNYKDAYLGITNLIPGQTIVINSSAPLSADYGVTFEDGMSAGNDYYFTATGTTASILVTKGTYNYIKTITVMGETETITLPADYTYSTFCSTSALDFTGNEAVEAYTATADGTTVTLTKVEKVPERTGVILKKLTDATTATVPVLASADAIENNALVAVTAPVSAASLVAAGNAYILVSDTQFSKVVNGATGEIPAGKAYMVYNAPEGASAMRLYIGEATAAASVEAQAQQAEQAVYTLQGIRVSKPTAKGLYIVNGKVCLFK